MKSSIIISSQPPSIYVFSQGDLKPQFTSTKPVSLCKSGNGEAATIRFLHICKRNRIHLLPTRVASTSIFLAATSPPNSGDFSVLFQTSAVMLFVYWIANFVVPEIVLKDLQVDKPNEERKQDEENLSEKRQGRTSSSGKKRRGFDSTKQ